VSLELSYTVPAIRAAIARASEKKPAQAMVGLVPTMGALHAGHASLLRAARRETQIVVVSIFVNPTQFGPSEDFSRYPRTWDADLRLCEAEGVDLIFAPDNAAMYPAGFQTYVEVQEFQQGLCGVSRPGHFRGVATVVLKLFNIVQPQIAYFGQKDAQQARIIQQLARDLDVAVKVNICPIVREPDGLALSSRNKYLDADQRPHATVLNRALEQARSQIAAGERAATAVTGGMAALVRGTPGAALDYAAAVDWNTLEAVDFLRGQVLLALAVRFGPTRLIDNIIIDVD
jgi:pantoate--beta-alanine ligase